MQVTFHGIAAEGEGVGRDQSGRAVFAPYAAPGDVAEIAISEERKSFARGQIIRLENASPQRVVPPCPYYLPKDKAPACGGCQLQHLNYQAQLEAKTQLVRDAFQRLGGFIEPPVEPCIASPQQFGYRNKAEMFVGENAIGYHARRTHHIVDIERCPLLGEELNQLLKEVRAALRGQETAVERFAMRLSTQGELALRLIGPPQAYQKRTYIFQQLQACFPNLRSAKVELEERVKNLRFQVGAFEFFQINAALTPILVQTALELANVQSGERALDLFCGSGLFGVFLARAGAAVEGVDVAGRLDTNARLNDYQARFARGQAAAFLQRAAMWSANYDLVLLDPPREGAAACVPSLIKLAPRRIVYVSCDPATLARDARNLAANGYCLRRAVPLDMFPQTAHVETVALLEREEV